MIRNYITYCAVIILAFGIVFVGGFIWQPEWVSKAEQTEPGVLSVYGEGIVYGKPTIARVNLGVETEKANAKAAQQENAKKMSEVVLALMDMGFTEDDIQTANFSIYPVRSNFTSDGEYKIVGYRVSNTLIVTVRDIDRVGDVLDIATQAGVNTVNGVTFDIEDSSELYHKALELAVSDALAKAEVIASAMGESLGKTLKVYESSSNRPARSDVYDAQLMRASTEYATPIIPGDVAIKASVSVEFGL